VGGWLKIITEQIDGGKENLKRNKKTVKEYTENKGVAMRCSIEEDVAVTSPMFLDIF